MPAQSQEVVPEARHSPREDVPQQQTTSTTAGNQARVEALGGGSTGEPRGGTRHTVQRGDTLYGIAETTYGSGRYWRDILRANPRSVFRGGEMILVGDVLDLPVIRVPPQEGAGGGAGGETPAMVPREVCTEWGDFRIYPDDYVGDLPMSPDATINVREAEFHDLVEQRERELTEQTDAAVGNIEALLSYGAVDWAITDADARAALARLAALPMRGLQAAIGRIDVARLLANLPSDAVATPDFCKVAVALGPERIAPFLADVLSYGLFEWTATDADVQAVMAVLGALGAEQRGQVLAALGPALQVRFMEGLQGRRSALLPADKAVLESIFDGAGNDLTRLTLAFSIRFNLDVRGTGGAQWDETGLRQSWAVLETLPAAHVEGNPELLQWIRYQKPDGTNAGNHSGWYDD